MSYPIIDELTGTYVIDRGRLIPADGPDAAELILPTGRKMFYEVIRVVRGIPLFWEDHLTRLRLSVGSSMNVPESLYDDSRRLIAANGISVANLRVVLMDGQAVLHLTPSAYPSPDQFRDGVPVGVLDWERESPNIKLIHSGYKAAMAARYAQTGPFGRYYELLLADQQGYLTEGSRSNLFFIRGDQVLTAPDDRILKGITRKHILEAITAAGGELVEEMLTLDDIRRDSCDAAFLSSSPFDILPIRAIEEVGLKSAQNAIVQKIDRAYRHYVDRYISDRSGA